MESGDIFDAIVVGAGIMGSSTAYQIAKRGRKVLLLEQFDFLHHRGSSHGESRTIRVTYPEEYYPKMVLSSEKLWEETEAEVGYKVYFKSSQLDMGPKENKSLQAVISSCRKNSIPVRILDQIQAREEFAGKIQLGDGWIGVVNDHGGVLKPTKAVAMFQTLAIKHGACLKDNAKVAGIRKDVYNGETAISVVTTDGRIFRGRKGIITSGAWMQKLVQTVSGMNLPVKPLETTIYYWKVKEGNEDGFTINGGFPSFASYGEPYIYGTPSLEYPGLIKIAVHGGVRCDPDKRTWRGTFEAVSALREWIKEKIGEMVEYSHGPVLTQSCMYSMTPDEDFIVDFLGGEEFGRDLVVAGGFSGHGFKMAPIIGKMLAELALDGRIEDESIELGYFRIGRFEGNPKGNAKDFGEQVK